MSRFRVFILVAVAAALAAAPASAPAATTSCGAVKGVGNGTSVTRVSTSSGSCPSAKAVAKQFARTRVAPQGYSCREQMTGTTAARVTCRRPGRTITFRVVWNGTMPLPAAPAPPSANS